MAVFILSDFATLGVVPGASRAVPLAAKGDVLFVPPALQGWAEAFRQGGFYDVRPFASQEELVGFAEANPNDEWRLLVASVELAAPRQLSREESAASWERLRAKSGDFLAGLTPIGEATAIDLVGEVVRAEEWDSA